MRAVSKADTGRHVAVLSEAPEGTSLADTVLYTSEADLGLLTLRMWDKAFVFCARWPVSSSTGSPYSMDSGDGHTEHALSPHSRRPYSVSSSSGDEGSRPPGPHHKNNPSCP